MAWHNMVSLVVEEGGGNGWSVHVQYVHALLDDRI